MWSALIVTSLVASALGFFVQTYAQQHAPPERTALILASEPAFAGLFGYLLADERLSAVVVARRAAHPDGDRRRGGRSSHAAAATAARGLTAAHSAAASLRSKQRDSGASR